MVEKFNAELVYWAVEPRRVSSLGAFIIHAVAYEQPMTPNELYDSMFDMAIIGDETGMVCWPIDGVSGDEFRWQVQLLIATQLLVHDSEARLYVNQPIVQRLREFNY